MFLFMEAARVVLRGVWFREEPLTLCGIAFWKPNMVDLQR